MNKKKSSTPIILVVLLAVVAAAVFGGLYLTRNIGKSNKKINTENVEAKLDRYVKQIDPITAEPVKGAVEFSDEDTTYQELPELTEENVAVSPGTSGDYVTIFASSEKTGTGQDGWLREMVEQYNAHAQVPIQLMTVSSGQQVDYVASGKFVPDAISPSNDLFIEMLNAKGVKTSAVADSLVTNYAGFVISKETYSTLKEEYGEVSVRTLAQATTDGKINTGYTNPFTSATGLNFLVTLLDEIAHDNILSEEATQGFVDFQKNIPFVALTTGQMRKAAEKGILDAFVLEYQSFVNDTNLSKNYQFIPFGFLHNNPLVAVKGVSEDHKAVLSDFVQYCKENGADLAKKDGFNTEPNGYKELVADYDGNTLIEAQKLYKENKDSKPIICVFVADTSGSMDGDPINALKESLVNSMKYISTDNYVGLVSYSNEVVKALEIGKFDLNQQSYFKGAVENLYASGATSTYEALCVAMKMIREKLVDIPDAKVMVFLLSDGMANGDLALSDVQDIVTGLNIPIYTIGYNAEMDDLRDLSDLCEAASIDASTDDVMYQLKQLFNANM